jgi:hypothetical protein
MSALTTHSNVYTFANPRLASVAAANPNTAQFTSLVDKVDAFFKTAPKFTRTEDEERLLLKDSMSLAYTTARGFQSRYVGQISTHTDLLLELTIDMKDLVFHHVFESNRGDPLFSEHYDARMIVGIDPNEVTDFQIRLVDRTCTYTEPGGKKIIIDLTRTDLPKPLQDFAALYFEAAEPFFHQRYQYDRNNSPLNGSGKVSPAGNTEFKKIQDLFIDDKLKGFEKAQTLFSHYMVTNDGAQRNVIMTRFAFCYFTHQELVKKFEQKINVKENELALAHLPKEKKKIEAQIEQLKKVKAEFEEMDYLAIGVVLGNFPDAAAPLKTEDLGQMELTLQAQIDASKKAAEKELREQIEFAKKDDKKKAKEQVDLEERYIRENCLGLFNLTRRTQLMHARALGIGRMPKHTLENVFVREALLFNTKDSCKGLKNYFDSMITDSDLKRELGYFLDQISEDIEEAVAKVPVPDTSALPYVVNPSTKNPPQTYLDARDAMENHVDNYLDALKAAAI